MFGENCLLCYDGLISKPSIELSISKPMVLKENHGFSSSKEEMAAKDIKRESTTTTLGGFMRTTLTFRPCRNWYSLTEMSNFTRYTQLTLNR